MPIPGLIDNDPTGSIKPRPSASANPFDSGDWREAEPALRAAMRAEAPAPPSTWSNPETGRRGRFISVAGLFKREGEACRAFLAKVEEPDGETAKQWQGVGCERGEGQIVLEDVAPWPGL